MKEVVRKILRCITQQEQIHINKLRKTNENFSYVIHEHSQGVRKERAPKIKLTLNDQLNTKHIQLGVIGGKSQLPRKYLFQNEGMTTKDIEVRLY